MLPCSASAVPVRPARNNASACFAHAAVLLAAGILASCAVQKSETPPPPPAGSAGSAGHSERAESAESEGVKLEGYLDESSAAIELGAADISGDREDPAPAMVLDAGGAGKILKEARPPAPASPIARRKAGSASESRARPAASGLNAGVADDNRQFNWFVDFLAKHGAEARHVELPVAERIALRAEDSAGRPILGAQVEILADGRVVDHGLTYADGSFLFFPRAAAIQGERYAARIRAGQAEMRADLDRRGTRQVALRFPGARRSYGRIPVDIVFVFDATGSMSEEIDRLKAAIELLHLNLSEMPGRPDVRFGMVVYRDRGDEYEVRKIALTGDLDAFAAALRDVRADGGGDTPEDLQSALDTAVRAMDWRPDGIRLGFVVTDAEAHLDYGQAYTYAEAAKDAKRRAIKFFSVGTGGLGISGEYQLRQIAQYTSGRYIFLTYGERGESEGGRVGAVSHHTGENFVSEKLDAVILRCAREEIVHQSDRPVEERDEYFLAHAVDGVARDASLQDLYRQALGQLSDYASMTLPDSMPAAILPIAPTADSLRANAEYFSEQLMLAGSRWGRLRLVDRKNLNQLLAEQSLALAGLTDPSRASEVGKMLGADCLVAGSLYRRSEGYEVFLRLVRVQTGEVLSATRARIDSKLGL